MKQKISPYFKPLLVLLFILILYSALGLFTNQIIENNRDNHEKSLSIQISRDIEIRIQDYLHKIESMSLFLDERKVSGIDYNEFYLLSSGLFDNDESIENISIAPNAVHEFVYPVEYNSMVGYDLLEDERDYVVEAVIRAKNSNEIVLSGPYPMRQDETKNIVVIRYPVYYDNGDFYGLINVVIDTTGLFQPSESFKYNDIEYQIIGDDEAIIYGPELYGTAISTKSIDLHHFGWSIAFGYSESYSNIITKEDAIRYTLFFSIFSLLLVCGSIIVISTGRTKLKKEKTFNEFIYMSYHDQLTGIFNRRFLFSNIDKLWRQSIRDRSSISFIMIDIDDFKLYNDSFGHIEGDQALLKIAEELKSSMTRPFDIVGRYGGEEFLVVLPNTHLDGAYKVAENIRMKIINLKIVHSEETNCDFLTISLGVTSIIPKINTKFEEAINHADIALFYAKENGKNRTEKYPKS